MKNIDQNPEPVIDLGKASAETKGTAIFDVDESGGQLRYLAGIADD